ncbi:MAG: hypothetical protein MJB14_13400 [Spirochaetes bacterium]|nr:hypothetical protein [Spirochaetota bacterium]
MSNNNIFQQEINKDKAKDAGMALVLILLLVSLKFPNNNLYLAALFILIINMIYPSIFKPFAYLWYGISNLLGLFMPKIILSIVYFILVVPVALVLKLFRIDLINLNNFKKETKSVFKTRNHTFEANDIEFPY